MYNCRHNCSEASSGNGGPSDSGSYMVSSFHYSPGYSAYRTQNATGAESCPGLRSMLYSVARLGLASVAGCRLRVRGKDEREKKSRDRGAREIGEVGRDDADIGSTKRSPRERTHRKYLRKFQKKLTEFTGRFLLP